MSMLLEDWERIDIITDGKSNVYWWNAKTNRSSWIDPEKLSLDYYQKRHAQDECKYVVFKPRKLRIAGNGVSMEDHPTLAVRRQELLELCFTVLVEENEKYGKMRGNTKTAKSCEKDGMRIGMQGIFARIVWFELLNEAQTIGEVGSHNRDSIFPTVFVGDAAVNKEFLDAGRTEEQTKDLMTKVGRAMMAASEELIRMRKELHAQPSTPLSTVIEYSKHIDNSKHRTAYYDLSYQGTIRSIGEEHLQKLLRLYQIHTNPLATLDDRTFLQRVYCVLSRYESLSGTSDGYQMAFPNIGFQYLRDTYDCRIECFASPLNCWNQRFCSVAKDTDVYFGSLGNFFLFNGNAYGRLDEETMGIPMGGSFEANPPFVEAVMDDMSDRIMYLLRSYPTVPFSFIVIVPGWDDCRGVIEMTNSEFTRPRRGYRLVLEKKKHDYRPGMQHRTEHSHQPSNVDTFVFYLQNDLGAAKWPVTDAQTEELKHLLSVNCGKDKFTH